MLHTSGIHNDYVSLGIEVNILPAAIEVARERGGIVVAQVNRHMPYTYGDAEIHLDDIDFVVEVDERISEHRPGSPDDTSTEIGDRIAREVSHGATLQLGIGAVPDAVLRGLTHTRNLRIWSEMFSDGVLPLVTGGNMDPDRPLTASFLFGTQRLYTWSTTTGVRMMRTEMTNDPGRIARQTIMTSVNGALQVDISAQANASRIDGEIYSGFGGSTDFIVGALHSRGGHAYIALPSWHPRANTSTIVPQIEGRSPRSSTPRSSPSRAWRSCSATARSNRPDRSSTGVRTPTLAPNCGKWRGGWAATDTRRHFNSLLIRRSESRLPPV